MSKSPTSEVIRLQNVRLSFARLFKPEPFEEGGVKTFQATFLLDPSDEKQAAKIKEIISAGKALVAEAFGKKATLKDLKGICFGKGDKLPTVYEGYEGMFYVRTANTTRPAVANRKGEPVAEEDGTEVPYSGCYVNGTLTLWIQNNKFGKRINANLRGVQFVRDGEAFGQAPISAEEEFDALEDNSPADSSDDFGDDFDDDIDF